MSDGSSVIIRMTGNKVLIYPPRQISFVVDNTCHWSGEEPSPSALTKDDTGKVLAMSKDYPQKDLLGGPF